MPSYSLEVVDRQPAVLGAGREHDGARRDLAGRPRAARCGGPLPGSSATARYGRRRARAELARLRDGAARQLRAADPGREAEVVLDPARGARLAAERACSRSRACRAPRRRRRRRRRGPPGRRRRRAGRPPRAARARARSRARARPRRSTGLRSSGPPGSRTSGSSSGVEPVDERAPPRPRPARGRAT